MAARKVFACCIAIAAFISLHSYGAARPLAHAGVQSGYLHPISGVVPISVHRKRQILDKLAPEECADRNVNPDGTVQHIFRGTRDIVSAVIKDVQAVGDELVQNLPLLPNLVDGLTEAVIYTLCGAQNAFSDAISDFENGPDMLTIALIDLLEWKGSAPLLNVPRAIVNATELFGKLGKDVIRDIVYGVAEGVNDLVTELRHGVGDVGSDVRGVVNAVESGLQMIGGGLGSGIHSILEGIEDGLGADGINVKGVVNAVENGVETIGEGLGSGIHNILDGVEGGLGGILDAL